MTLAENNTMKSTVNDAVSSVNDDVAIREKITKLKNEVKSLGASLAATGGEEAKRVMEKGEDLAHGAVNKSREALDFLSTELETYEAQLVNRVRTRPIQSMGLAVGAGIILALMLRK
jgi:ElaB/YqjD/DUF883 family membrane-anchored ribosome-binding protein